METIQILTKNNNQTIKNALDSIQSLQAKILVGDLGSVDGTIDVCKSYGATVFSLKGKRRDEARNYLITQAGEGTHFYIEPWECVIQGKDLPNIKKTSCVRIMRGNTFTYETRIWHGKHKFINPVYERLDAEGSFSKVMLYSNGQLESDDVLSGIEIWKRDKPLAAAPYYYHACLLFSQGKYDEFLKMADHYLFMEKEEPLSNVMMRYYYAMAHVTYKKSYKPALQNINLCLCARPLMAEFWCLTGDVYYHLLHKFDQAKEFYENAMILGSRRSAKDIEPMDIDKYRAYPTKMIESCNALLSHKGVYAQMSRL
jgi:tetratricopeptide (TPR) repeat protein